MSRKIVRYLRDDMILIPTQSAGMASDRKRPWFLKAWRKKRGLSQQALADLVGSSKGYISDLENGVRRYNQEILEGFAIALLCEPRDLLTDPTDDDLTRQLQQEIRDLNDARKAQAIAVIRALKATGTNG